MSTILDALKKIEGQGGAQKPADPNELTRQIVHGGSSSVAKPVRRGAIVVLAIVVSAVAGAGLTMLGLSYMGEHSATPAVASPGPDAADGDQGLVGVEVAGEVEEVVAGERVARAGGGAASADDIEADPVTELMARAPAPDSLRTPVVTATPPADREPVVIPPPPGARNQLDPARKLAARREARVSRSARNAEANPAAQAPAPAAEKAKSEAEATNMAATQPESKPPVVVARTAEPKAKPAPPQRKPKSKPAAPAARTPRRAMKEKAIARAQAKAAPAPAPALPIERPPVEIVDIARAKPTPPPAAEPKREVVEEPVPTIPRASIPKIGVTATTWHPYKSRRSAELTLLEDGGAKLHTVRQGDTVGPYKVREITPSGVTLVHEGVEMQRRVGAEAR